MSRDEKELRLKDSNGSGQFGEGDDISNSQKTRLGDYLSSMTETGNKSNEYKISPGSSEWSYQSEDGAPAPLTQPGLGVDNHYLDDVETAAKNYFNMLSRGSHGRGKADDGFAVHGGEDLVTDTEGTTIIDKNAQTAGHHIYGDMKSGARATADTENPVQQKISSVLQYNRWNQEPGKSPYVEEGELSNGMYTAQRRLGVYDPTAESVKIDHLRKVGLSLMLKASGDDNSTSSSGALDPDGLKASNVLMPDGIASVQMASAKVDIAALRTGAAAGAGRAINPATSALTVTDNNGTGNRLSKSYGQLNTYLEPFGGGFPAGMVANAALTAVIGLVVAIAIGFILDVLTLPMTLGASDPESPPDPLPMGSRPGTKPFGNAPTWTKWVFGPIALILGKILGRLGLPQLRDKGAFGYTVAAIRGSFQFYMGSSTDQIVWSPGYFAVINRAAIRDFEQIESAFGDASGAFSDPVGAAEAIFTIIDAIGTSTSYLFVKNLILMGEIVADSGGFFEGGVRYISGLGPDRTLNGASPAGRFYMSRRNGFDGGGSPLSIGANTSLLLLPAALLGAREAQGIEDNSWARGHNDAFLTTGFMQKISGPDSFALHKKFQSMEAGQNRFAKADVEIIETALEAEYVPFYFHDLRTNEILSFHAFIDSVTDSFSPKYKSTSAYGRTDPVNIYQETTRKLGVTFHVAAMSPGDFDEMWISINRLIMMIYPQWSLGTKVEDMNGNRFVVPFSQIPTASPLIRMRIGNLFRSNYSEVNLGRMFGMGRGEDTFTFDSSAYTQGRAADVAEEALAISRRMCNSFPLDSDMMKLAAGVAMPFGVDAGLNVGDEVIIGREGADERYSQYATGFSLFPRSRKKVVVKDGETLRCKVVKTVHTRKAWLYLLEPLPESEEDATNCGLKKKHGVLFSRLRLYTGLTGLSRYLCRPYIQATAAANVAGPSIPGIEPPVEMPDITMAQAFLSDNAVVRSFQSAAGRGIAGHITSLTMDWNQATWDTGPNRKAPMACKITMNFAPAHDLPLGLDSDGAMIAPVYPVGDSMGTRGMGGDPHQTLIIDGPGATPGKGGTMDLGGTTNDTIAQLNERAATVAAGMFNPGSDEDEEATEK